MRGRKVINGCVLMKLPFPYFRSRKRAAKSGRQDEELFAQASELALLRLEQCMADLQKNDSSLEMEFHLPSDERVH